MLNKKLEESIKREEFQKNFDSLMSLYKDFDDLKLQTELQSLIQSSNIDISCPYKDTFYEDLIDLLKDFEVDSTSDMSPIILGEVSEAPIILGEVLPDATVNLSNQLIESPIVQPKGEAQM